jgi:hypothetical protein
LHNLGFAAPVQLQVWVANRLGYMNIFNPKRPALHYRLRMWRPDDHEVRVFVAMGNASGHTMQVTVGIYLMSYYLHDTHVLGSIHRTLHAAALAIVERGGMPSGPTNKVQNC